MILCRKCKGTGEVFNPSSLFLGPFIIPALILNAEITRKECPECKGIGFHGNPNLINTDHNFTRNVEQFLCPG